MLFIDMSKGIAIIAIVMLHLCGNLTGESARLISFFNHSWDTRLFFLLSGMVAALGGAVIDDKHVLLHFFKKKTNALLLPFVVWSTIIIPYVFKQSLIYDYWEIFVDEIVPPYGGYWFLLYLWVIQVIFGSMKYISSKIKFVDNDLYKELLVSVVFSILMFPIYEYTIFFIIGYFAFHYGKHVLFNDYLFLLSFVAFVMLFVLFRYDKDISKIIQFLLAITASVAVINLSEKMQTDKVIEGRCGSILCFFGRNSLEIYLIHYLLVWILSDVRISVDNIHSIPLYIVVLGISIIVCYLCCLIGYVLKRVPYLSLILFGNRQ